VADIVIRIAGNIEDFDKELDKVNKTTEGLQDRLSTVAKVSGVAFAALTAEVGFSVAAFAKEEQALAAVNTALGNQGIFTVSLAKAYREYAEEIEAKTGIDGESISMGQAQAQALMGQEKITRELTQAVVDFATAQKMDVEQAFNLVGKSIGTSTNALSRYGVEIDSNATAQQKNAAIIQALSSKYHGQAEAATAGAGSIKLLTAQFENFQKAIGSRFSPMVEAASRALSGMLKYINDNKGVADFVASLVAAGLVVSGLVTVVAAGGIAFLQLRAALLAAKVATSAMSLAVKGLVGATGLGIIVLVASEIYLNWSSIWPRMQAAFQAFVWNIGTLGSGLASILKGVFTFDVEMIKSGLEEAKSAFTTGFGEYKNLMFEAKLLADEEELAQNKIKQDALNEQKKLANAAILTEEQLVANKIKEINKQADDQRIADKAKAQITYLDNEKKFGKNYATIKQALESDEVKGAKDTFGELANLQNSGNATLKAAGKAGALANIAIKTAEGATGAYAGAIAMLGPIFGPPIGTAVAAGVIAFGAEQAGKIIGLAKGGLVTGGIAGVDSVPIMAQRNELMAPAQSFDEVIGSVRAKREAEKLTDGPLGESGATVVLQLVGDIGQIIEAKIIERRRMGISLLQAGFAT